MTSTSYDREELRYRRRDSSARNDSRNNERIIKEKVINVERKEFKIALKENRRGQFVRITESKSNGQRSTVIVPLGGVAEIIKSISSVVS